MVSENKLVRLFRLFAFPAAFSPPGPLGKEGGEDRGLRVGAPPRVGRCPAGAGGRQRRDLDLRGRAGFALRGRL